MMNALRKIIGLTVAAGLAAATGAAGQSAVRKDVAFEVTANVGFGNEVVVFANHPDLGGGDLRRAPKLVWHPGNEWRGAVALPAGDEIAYQFFARNFSPTAWKDPAAGTPIGPAGSVVVDAHPAPPWRDKAVYYASGWAAPQFLFRDLSDGGGPWTSVPMRRVGDGRHEDEALFVVTSIAASGAELEFVFHNGAGTFDNAPAPPSGAPQESAPGTPAPYQGLTPPFNYRCGLDVFLVRDGAVFNYRPADEIDPPRFESRPVTSSVTGIVSRTLTVLLPRGYNQHTAKRYPVAYFHDGQNVFFPGGSFGTWDADRIANFETAQGRMRETIIVGIPNSSARLREYLPDGDNISQGGDGMASAYLEFFLNDVKPLVDNEFRTLDGPADTIMIGSSMGGLVSDYMGANAPGMIGSIGIFSPSYWAAPNWVATSDAMPKLPLRRFLTIGTNESGTSQNPALHWENVQHAFNRWSALGHPVHRDLLFIGGVDAGHDEPSWSRRLPGFFAFALDPWLEANPLALEFFPPSLAIVQNSFSEGGMILGFTGLFGAGQELLGGSVPGIWTETHDLPSAQDWWDWTEFSAPVPTPMPPRWFWSLRHSAWPD